MLSHYDNVFFKEAIGSCGHGSRKKLIEKKIGSLVFLIFIKMSNKKKK